MAQRSQAPNVLSITAGVLLLALLTFSVLQWLQMPVGTFIDWLIGIVAFVWLMTLITVPWNIYFEAREVLSLQKNPTKPIPSHISMSYVSRVAVFSLLSAIVLHILTAAGLYWLAYQNISAVGYYASVVAAILTFLRPSMSAYEYLSAQLAAIRQEVDYPKEDVYALKKRVLDLEILLKNLSSELDESKEDSWRKKIDQKIQQQQSALRQQQQQLESLYQNNEQAHEQLAQQTQKAVAQLTQDGQFINNIVEIIRFIKRV
ncbi:hypothetical protein [Eisenibacter elegans]|uniref:hypothetical protein n=1 Tax=Eisenibacter elegans TaxID=997 RepID=UPI000418A7FE|nr:hypothetical protein [Eisenibacter elegans]